MADLDQDDDPDIVIGGIWFENTIKNNEPTWQPHRFGEWHAALPCRSVISIRRADGYRADAVGIWGVL